MNADTLATVISIVVTGLIGIGVFWRVFEDCRQTEEDWRFRQKL